MSDQNLLSASRARPDWERLAREVRGRREQQRLSQADVAERGGPAEATVRRIELGQATRLRGGTRAALERALAWRDGTVDHILDGTVTEAELNGVYARAGVAAGLAGAGRVTVNADHPRGSEVELAGTAAAASSASGDLDVVRASEPAAPSEADVVHEKSGGAGAQPSGAASASLGAMQAGMGHPPRSGPEAQRRVTQAVGQALVELVGVERTPAMTRAFHLVRQAFDELLFEQEESPV